MDVKLRSLKKGKIVNLYEIIRKRKNEIIKRKETSHYVDKYNSHIRNLIKSLLIPISDKYKVIIFINIYEDNTILEIPDNILPEPHNTKSAVLSYSAIVKWPTNILKIDSDNRIQSFLEFVNNSIQKLIDKKIIKPINEKAFKNLTKYVLIDYHIKTKYSI